MVAGSKGKRFWGRGPSREPRAEPQSSSRRCGPDSTRCMEPVTDRVAPRNVTRGPPSWAGVFSFMPTLYGSAARGNNGRIFMDGCDRARSGGLRGLRFFDLHQAAEFGQAAGLGGE